MFCKKCGLEINDEDKYCPHCGTNQVIKVELFASQKKGVVAYYLQFILSPIMFIIRMLSQERERLGYWQIEGDLVVPENIKAIMYILTVASLVFTFTCSSKKETENKKKIRIAKILSVINLLVCICIIEVVVN